MIDDAHRAEIVAHYKTLNPNGDERDAREFTATVEFQFEVERRKMADEITALKAKIALLEAKINTTKKIIKHCQPVEPSYANEEWIDALTAINKCLQ